MKSKVDVKEQLKQDFVDLLTGCTISFDFNDIDYKKDGSLLLFYSKTNNYFYFRYKIWSNFQLKYSLTYQELKELLIGIIEGVLNYKGVTPIGLLVW